MRRRDHEDALGAPLLAALVGLLGAVPDCSGRQLRLRQVRHAVRSRAATLSAALPACQHSAAPAISWCTTPSWRNAGTPAIRRSRNRLQAGLQDLLPRRMPDLLQDRATRPATRPCRRRCASPATRPACRSATTRSASRATRPPKGSLRDGAASRATRPAGRTSATRSARRSRESCYKEVCYTVCKPCYETKCVQVCEMPKKQVCEQCCKEVC